VFVNARRWSPELVNTHVRMVHAIPQLLNVMNDGLRHMDALGNSRVRDRLIRSSWTWIWIEGLLHAGVRLVEQPHQLLEYSMVIVAVVKSNHTLWWWLMYSLDAVIALVDQVGQMQQHGQLATWSISYEHLPRSTLTLGKGHE
jgi:hypothetical protein